MRRGGMDDPPSEEEQKCSSSRDRRSRRSPSLRPARSSSSSRSSRGSATPWGTPSVAPCCPRSRAQRSARSGSRACCTSSRRSPRSPRTSPKIIMNLKELVVRSEADEPVTIYLKAKGPGSVTAGDIAPPAGVEILNPDLRVATLGKGGSLEMEMNVERGVGYRMADKNKNPRDP